MVINIVDREGKHSLDEYPRSVFAENSLENKKVLMKLYSRDDETVHSIEFEEIPLENKVYDIDLFKNFGAIQKWKFNTKLTWNKVLRSLTASL